MFADLRLQGVHGVCITVLSVRRAADLVTSALAPPCDPLSASPRDIWHPMVDCAELGDKRTDSLGRCTAQCRACRQDSSALEEDLHQQMELQKFWKPSVPSSLPSEQMELQCAVYLTEGQKNTGEAGRYFCPALEEKPPWSHSTEAPAGAGESPGCG